MLVTRVERFAAVAAGGGDRVRVLALALEVSVRGTPAPDSGMVVNLATMKEVLRNDVVAWLDGRRLDGRGGAPHVVSQEALARAIWQRLGGNLAGRPIARIRLATTPGPAVETSGGEEMDVTRVYEFSASHRLHAPALSAEENAKLFGKCNNPSGHGHNYVLEVTLRGRLEERAELLEAETFDRIVKSEVVDRWDHRHLNVDLQEFDGINPTAEEIARVAWRRLAAPFAAAGGARLFRLKLRETERNHVEYFGDAEDAR